MSSDTVRQRPRTAAGPGGDANRSSSKAGQKSPRASSQPSSSWGCVTLLKLGVVLFLLVPVATFLLYINIVPAENYPVPYSLPDPPVIQVNNHLAAAERLYEGKIESPEQIVHHHGEIYTGTADGRIVRISREGEITTIARIGKLPCDSMEDGPTCGRPLGMKFDADGYLIVCDAFLGLHKINVATGDVHVMLPSSVLINGQKLNFLNNLDIASDGLIYLSDASRYSMRELGLSFFDGRATGRLLRYNPVTNVTELLVDKLSFANGVQLSPYEDFVLVAETMLARILKYHLKGVKAGQTEVFADNLPCLPDNIRPSYGGGYWTGAAAARFQGKAGFGFDFLAPRPWLRKLLSWLPVGPIVDLDPVGSILVELNQAGDVVRTLLDLEGKTVRMAADVEDVEGVLYIGTFRANYMARIDARKL